jgi:hypothetical protein
MNLRDKNKRRTKSSTICALSYLGNQNKKDEMNGACSTCGQMKNANKIMVRKPKGKKQFVIIKHIWK